MTDLKQIARQLFHETLAGIDIAAALDRRLQRTGARLFAGDDVLDLSEYPHIFAIVFGKAGFAMAEGLARVLAPDFQAAGILVVPTLPDRALPGFRTFVGGHPIPTHESLLAARAILEMLGRADERTLVFFLLSGGGSALVEAPLDDDVSLDDLRQLNRVLVTCGAPIDDINAVRKHLSAVKGGRLAVSAARSMKITLGISDVPMGKESALASGPTIPDPTTVADVLRVIEEWQLLSKLPASIHAKLQQTSLRETPKPGDPAFARARFELLLGATDLFRAAQNAAEAAGFASVSDNTTDDWPVAQAAHELVRQLDRQVARHPGRPVAVIAGGEVSSPVTGSGVGGRNSAFVLCCVPKIAGRPIAVLSMGTDGIDGNSPAAGAVADGSTLARARHAGLDPEDFFRRSDAYTFFAALEDQIEIGPTGNNLRDLRLLLALPA